jgi:2-(1,2-epoxy-1,2-dihydrophenyl)acetyl-CoA isomerase
VADIRVVHDGPVARVVLDNPDRKNRLDAAAMAALADAARTLGSRQGATRAVVVSGTGAHFCAGGDLAGGVGFGEELAAGDVTRAILDGPQATIAAWWALDLPVIAAVHGHAAGMGACLALTADVVVAAESAVFRFPFAQLGFGPDSGASWLLSRRLGAARAGTILMLGTAIDAVEAFDLGLVHRLVGEGELDDVVDDYAQRLAGGATVALRHTKRLLRASGEQSLASALTAEAETFEAIAGTKDFAEGIAAFFERRPPVFGGS